MTQLSRGGGSCAFESIRRTRVVLFRWCGATNGRFLALIRTFREPAVPRRVITAQNHSGASPATGKPVQIAACMPREEACTKRSNYLILVGSSETRN